jgi:heptose I phosphotransferase
MLWIHADHRATFAAAAAHTYDAIAALQPADHYVEKQGRSTGRYVIGQPGRATSLFVKKYFQLRWWDRWWLSLERYPGPRERANLERAAALGVPVPQPLVAGADRDHACHSILAVRELVGYLPLHQFIPMRFAGRDTKRVRVLRRHLTRRLADITHRLHSAQLYHCDLYLCHFFIRDSSQSDHPLDVVLIDFMRLKHSMLQRWRVKDLAQLLFSSDLPGITRTDRLRFFKQYLGLPRLDDSARRLLRRVQRKAALYHRHNQSLARRAAA